jgi:hypothetical protein
MYLYRCLYFFGIFGPMIASLFIWVVGPYLYFGAEISPDLVENFARLALSVSFVVFFLVVALFLGIVPGLATGLVYWLLKTRTVLLRGRKGAAVLVMAVVGGLLCAVFAMVVDPPTVQDAPLILFGFVLPGMLAAAICTLLLERKSLPLESLQDASG